MIVMSIIALVMSLVGPLTIQGYEKIQAKEEHMTLQNWIKGNSYRSFATSKPGVITLANNLITFHYQENSIGVANGHLSNPYQIDATTDEKEQEGNQVIAGLTFEFLTFPEQTIQVNTFGLIQPSTITILVAGNERVIDLSKKVNGNTQ